MTLDVEQFFAENIYKEMRISHFIGKVYCGKPQHLKEKIRNRILSKMGEKWLNDADMAIIITGSQLNEDADAKKKLFGILDRSLGTISNNMNKSDIKRFYKKQNDENVPKQIDFVMLKITFK